MGFDHVAIVVDDIAEGRRFFEMLGFEEAADVTVSGPEMAAYMGIADWKAEHLTLRMVINGLPQEVQLLHFHQPEPTPDPFGGSLARIGFNHLCFRVTDLDRVIARLATGGYQPRNDIMAFHNRRLVFFDAPGGTVIEFAEWTA